VEPWVWAAFLAGVGGLLAVDLLVVHRRPRAIGMRLALLQSAAWIALGLAFSLVILAALGRTAAGEYLSAYLIEKSLSGDNVFAWALIFSTFAVPAAYQHRVLFWGVLGAIVLRGAFILAGVALVDRFAWLVPALGVVLLVTAVRLVVRDDSQFDPSRNAFARAFARVVPTTHTLRGSRFSVREHGRWLATPLLVVLVLIESTDLVFAVDSVPAVLGVSHDAFVVFSSNVLAILGLRALYFVFAAAEARFSHLQQGMVVILVFVGAKMVLSPVVDVPIGLSLAVIALVLSVSVLSSLRVTPGEERWPGGGPRRSRRR
jgi:tellurite resistance protein TerC